MQTIWKYPMPLNTLTLTLPRRARVLTAQIQDSLVTLWILLDPTVKAERLMEERRFELFGTDWEINHPPENLHYINTVQYETGRRLVYHVFEIVDQSGVTLI